MRTRCPQPAQSVGGPPSPCDSRSGIRRGPPARTRKRSRRARRRRSWYMRGISSAAMRWLSAGAPSPFSMAIIGGVLSVTRACHVAQDVRWKKYKLVTAVSSQAPAVCTHSGGCRCLGGTLLHHLGKSVSYARRVVARGVEVVGAACQQTLRRYGHGYQVGDRGLSDFKTPIEPDR